jgi:hypothetical protein
MPWFEDWITLTFTKRPHHILIRERVTHTGDSTPSPSQRIQKHRMHHFSKVIRDRDRLYRPLTSNARARKGVVPLVVRIQRESAKGPRVFGIDEVFKVPGGPGANDGVEGRECAREVLDAAFCWLFGMEVEMLAME